MDPLEYYPRIYEATQRYPSVNEVYHTLLSTCNGAKRRSGRPVIDHFFGTTEIALPYFANNPAYINGVLLHDVIEDYDLSHEDVTAIAGPGVEGEASATIVNFLSKPRDIENKGTRDKIYMKRLWNIAIGKRERHLAIAKLADRIDNLKDLDALPPDRIRLILQQSLQFYYPTAMRSNLLILGNKLLKSIMRYLQLYRSLEGQII